MRRVFLIAFLLISLVGGSLVAAQEDEETPAITHGPITGEITEISAVLWARAGQASDLIFEVFDNEEQSGDPVAEVTVAVDEETDFTGKALVEDLEPETTYYFTVSAAVGGETLPDSVQGEFATAPAYYTEAGFDFTFGAGLGGQGYCRPPETGWTIFETMLNEDPEFFVFLGDTIYADNPCPSEDEQNVPGAENVAKYLFQFRERYQYHLDDPHYTNLLAETPVYVTWDDHEVMDNFSGQNMMRINLQLFEDAEKAFFEYWPVMGVEWDPYLLYRSFRYGAHAEFFILDTRTYRDPIVDWDPSPVTGEHKTMLGQDQFEWLLAGLDNSDATWKFIVSSVPLSYPTGWPQPQVEGHDGWANGPDPSGYETELTRILYYLESHQITNVIFLTGDTHWPAALLYDPDLDTEPNFYEFSSSPLSALPLEPSDLDMTFNPRVLYARGETGGDHFNFGRVAISDEGALSLYFVRDDGVELFSLDLLPE